MNSVHGHRRKMEEAREKRGLPSVKLLTKKQHRNSAPSLGQKKKTTLSVPTLHNLPPPLIKAPPSPMGSCSERSMTPSGSGSGSSPKPTSRPLYTPYGTEGDLYNDFAAGFDPVEATFCFQCTASCDTPSLTLTRTVECTGFSFTKQPPVDIYRPLYSCTDCLKQTLARKAVDPQHRVRLVESCMAFYATQPL